MPQKSQNGPPRDPPPPPPPPPPTPPKPPKVQMEQTPKSDPKVQKQIRIVSAGPESCKKGYCGFWPNGCFWCFGDGLWGGGWGGGGPSGPRGVLWGLLRELGRGHPIFLEWGFYRIWLYGEKGLEEVFAWNLMVFEVVNLFLISLGSIQFNSWIQYPNLLDSNGKVSKLCLDFGSKIWCFSCFFPVF